MTIFSLIISIIPLIIPEVSILLNKHLFWIIIIILLMIFLCRFYNWKQNNFFTTNVSMESMLIIDGKNDNKLTFNIAQLVVPSEDTLFLKLKLEFDEDVQRELQGNYYTLIFSKPIFLEMTCRNPQMNMKPYVMGLIKNIMFLNLNIIIILLIIIILI